MPRRGEDAAAGRAVLCFGYHSKPQPWTGASSMKRILTALLFGIMIVPAASGQQRQMVDAVAAVVDQQIILLSDVQMVIGAELQALQQNVSSRAEYERQASNLMSQALEEVIESNILYREALRDGLQIKDDIVETRVDAFKADYDTEEEAMAYLEETGFTLNDIRDRERKRILASAVLRNKQMELDRLIVISEAEITEFYEANKDEFDRPERARLRQIMLRAPEGSEEQSEAVARMEVLREEILNGASFEELAKKYSDAFGADDGGIVGMDGWTEKGALLPVLDSAAFALETGEVSEVLVSQLGVHLLRLDEKSEAGAVDMQDARGMIEPMLRQQMISERLNLWVSDLRKLSNVRVFL